MAGNTISTGILDSDSFQQHKKKTDTGDVVETWEAQKDFYLGDKNLF